ncbi:hypothetical protein [Nocardia sp. NPDC057455]
MAEGSVERDLADAVGGADAPAFPRPVHELNTVIGALLTRA